MSHIWSKVSYSYCLMNQRRRTPRAVPQLPSLHPITVLPPALSLTLKYTQINAAPPPHLCSLCLSKSDKTPFNYTETDREWSKQITSQRNLKTRSSLYLSAALKPPTTYRGHYSLLYQWHINLRRPWSSTRTLSPSEEVSVLLLKPGACASWKAANGRHWILIKPGAHPASEDMWRNTRTHTARLWKAGASTCAVKLYKCIVYLWSGFNLRGLSISSTFFRLGSARSGNSLVAVI